MNKLIETETLERVMASTSPDGMHFTEIADAILEAHRLEAEEWARVNGWAPYEMREHLVQKVLEVFGVPPGQSLFDFWLSLPMKGGN